MRSSIHSIAAAAALLLGAMGVASPGAAAQEWRIGDWKLVCPEGGNAEGSKAMCFMTQEIVSTETELGVAAMAVAIPPGQKRPLVAFNLAPQIDPSKPLGLKIDEMKTLYLPITGCDAQKCSARANLRDDLLDSLRKGNKAILSFSIPGQPKPVGVVLSLKGFTAAYKALEERRPG